MALKAGNEVVGGNTLRRAAIASPNFVTGISGWSINQDGSAEFNNVVIRNGQVVSGTALYYSGPPALGNLVASVSAAAGTDTPGNHYLAGVASYRNTAPFGAIQVNGNSLLFWSQTAAGGVLTPQGSVTGPNTGDLNLFGSLVTNNVNAQSFFKALFGASVAGGLTVDTLNAPVPIAGALAAGLLLTITNTTGGATSELIRAVVQAAGDSWFGFRVAGDTANRLIFDTTAGGLTRIRLGGGAGAPDINVQRLAANQLGILNADLAVDSAGRGLQVKEGSNARQGTAILAGGSVVVANTSVTANTRIYPGYVVPSANAGAVFCSAVTVGTGFTLKSTNAADTSTVSYLLVETAP